jgi:hypothetical protein
MGYGHAAEIFLLKLEALARVSAATGSILPGERDPIRPGQGATGRDSKSA